MTKCPQEYKNIGIESFGNKKKITEEMLAQFCKNDSYLYGKVKDLFNLTDPESRKRHFPPFSDDAKCYNIVYDSNSNSYTFDDETSHKLDVYFKNNEQTGYNVEDYIDIDKSTLEVDTENGNIHIPLSDYDTTLKWEEVKQETKTISSKKTVYGKAVMDSYYEGPYGKFAPNGTWYAGYNYTKTYSVSSKWKKNPYDPSYKIPSLSRAETFQAQHTGKISSVTLNVKADKKTAYPLRVEIRTTNSKGYPTSKILGYATKKFNHTNLALEAFQFKTTVPVKKGTVYAIVIRCPLAPYSASYHIAGWQQGCYTKKTWNALKEAHKKRGVGYSFESTDNCNTFKKYNAGDGAGYKDSSKNPVAFGYEVKISPSSTKIVEEEITVTTTEEMEEAATTQARQIGKYYLYLKPLKYENIVSVISKISEIDNYNSSFSKITHYISPDGKNWYNAEDTGSSTGVIFNFGSPYKDFLYYKICIELLKQDTVNWSPQKTIPGVVKPVVNPQTIYDSFDDNPLLKTELFLSITLEDIPKNAYLRTLPYIPISDEMLPPCIWAEFNTKYDQTNKATVNIDIIRDIEQTEGFKIVKPTLHDLRGYELIYSNNKAQYKQTTDYIDYLKEYNKECTAIGDLSDVTTDEKVNEFVKNNIDRENNILDWLYDNYDLYLVGFYDADKHEGRYYSKTPNSKLAVGDYLAYPVINCDLKHDDLYLINKDFLTSSVSETSGGVTTTNYYFYSLLVNNFPEQIQKVELVDVSNDFEVVHEFQEKITDEFKNYLYASAVRGYFDSVNKKFYYHHDESGYSSLIEPVDGKKYADISDEENIEYYIYSEISNQYNLIEGWDGGADAEWQISETTGRKYSLEILYNHLSDDVQNTYFTKTGEKIELKNKYAIKVTFNDNNMIEGVDYETDYENGKLKFYNFAEDDTDLEADDSFLWTYDSFQTGNLSITYNPLFVRGLTNKDLSEDSPLRMDLWEDYFQIINTTGGIQVAKIRFNDYGNIEVLENIPMENNNYVLHYSVNAVDNLREVVIEVESDNDEETEIMEDMDFTVDYIKNKIYIDSSKKLILDSITKEKRELQVGDIINVKYTPDLREFGLNVGYRLHRESISDKVNIYSYYFTTRT